MDKVLCIVKNTGQQPFLTTETYNLFTPITLIAGFVITTIGLFLAIAQLRQNRRSREAQICLTLSQLNMSSDMQVAFDYVWELDYKMTIPIDAHSKVEKACVFFELVGTFIVERYMATHLIAGFYGSLLTGCYDNLYPFILDQRKKPYNNNYASNFEKAACALSSDRRVSVISSRERKNKLISTHMRSFNAI